MDRFGVRVGPSELQDPSKKRIDMGIALKIFGALAVLIGSFFLALSVMDYFGVPSPPIVRLIKVEEATYGGNCGAGVSAGNATQYFAKACDGRPSCKVVISVQELGDPAQGCGKDFSVRFLCDQQVPVRVRHLHGEANGSTVSLDCQTPD